MIALLSLLSTSCTGDCVGAGCDDAYDATWLAVHVAGDKASTTVGQSARTAQGIVGTEQEGEDWSAVGHVGGLIIGAPELGEVRSVALADGRVGLDDGGTGSLVGEELGDRFGESLRIVPDMDGDGVDELWVGAPDRTGGASASNAGAAYLFMGLGGGWSGERDAADAELRVLSEASSDHLGRGLAVCGDQDGDGVAELLMGAPWDETAATLGGRVHLLQSGLNSELGALVLAGELDRSWWAQDEGARAGEALVCDRDLDGDGLADIAIGVPFADGTAGEASGAVYLLAGASIPESGALEDVAVRLEGLEAESYLGWSITTSDLDGDGAFELVAGAPGADGATGQVLVYDAPFAQSAPRFLFDGEQPSERFGTTVWAADLSGDGADELIVGAPKYNPSGSDVSFAAGAVRIWRGGAGFNDWPRSQGADSAQASILTAEAYLRTGQTITSADVDGDGLQDLLLGLSIEP